MNRIPSPPSGVERVDSRVEARVIPAAFLDDGRERNRTGDAVIDPYNIDDIRAIYCPTNGDPAKGNITNEVDFQWKAHTTYGKPNYTQLVAHEQQGWKTAQHADFPGRFAPPGTEGAVIINDMILMHRPMRLTVQARQEEYNKATRAMQVHRKKME